MAIFAQSGTTAAEREFDLWLTFVAQPTRPMKRKTATASPEPTEAEIQRAAYFIWLDSGKPAGRALEHWLAAKDLLSICPIASPRAARRRRAAFALFPAAPDRIAHN